MKLKLATVILKVDKCGSTVCARNVTPPELMFLVADNHVNAGGDPVISLTLEKKLIEAEVPDLDGAGLPIKRNGKVVKKQGFVPGEEDVEVSITPANERRRLSEKYGTRRIAKFYPGPIPQMPETFEEAREVGLQSITPTERLLTVGDTGE